MTAMPKFRIHELAKTYGGAFCLEIPELQVGAGEILALLGPTGSGKSTLLRLIGGLDPPSAGTLQIEGSTHGDGLFPLALRRRITMVAQRPILLSGSVRQNIELGLRLRRKRDRRSLVDRLLDQLDLRAIADRNVFGLSGGQIQLVAVARALVLEPDMLLLDEPTAHLDPAHVALVESAIESYHREAQATIVWATHNLFQARRASLRAALLLNGRLIEAADTESFFVSPSDPRTADFVLGRMVY